MAKIITLHDNVTDEALYPKTIASSVFLSNGDTVESKVLPSLYPSVSTTINSVVDEIFTSYSLPLTATIYCPSGGSKYIQIADASDNSVLCTIEIGQARAVEGDIFSATTESGDFYVRLLSPSALEAITESTGFYALSQNVNNLKYATRISEALKSNTVSFGGAISKSIKELYLNTTEENVLLQIYAPGGGSSKILQAFDSTGNTLLCNFDITGKPNSVVKGTDGVSYCVVADDISYLTVSSLKFPATAKAYSLVSNPVLYSSLHKVYVSEDDFLNSILPELYIPITDDTQLYARISVYQGTKELQIFNANSTSSENLIEGWDLNSITEDGIYYGVHHAIAKLTNLSSISTTTSLVALNEIVKSADAFPSLYSFNNNQFFVDKTGMASFETSLLRAILKATSVEGATLYVFRGTYNFIEEFEELYGATFFSDFTSDTAIRGAYLKNKVRIVFSAGAKVSFNYDGDNEAVMQYFSPFNSGDKGFTLENAVIEASKCRYIIHDERNQSADFYVNTYINCDMSLDNTYNTAWTSGQCIGGGLGKNGVIKIHGSRFTSVGSASNVAVSYHNSSAANAQSTIDVSGNYFSGNNTFALLWYGTTTLHTVAKVYDNSLGAALVHRGVPGAETENTELLAWNNDLRS